MRRIELRGIRSAGIRKRLMFSLVSFVGFVILVLWLFQIVFLNDFYHLYKRHRLSVTAALMVRNLDSEDLSVLAEHLAEDNESCILLLDEQGQVLLSAEGLRLCLLHHMSARDLAWWCENVSEDGKPTVQRFTTQGTKNQRYNSAHFRGEAPSEDPHDVISLVYGLRCTLPDGSRGTLLLNTLVTPVDATVSTLRFQLLTITLIVLVAALILAFSMSQHVSRPIIETNEAAKALARGSYTPPAHSNRYREITELNATLASAAEELSKVESLQHELIANISHDLRTPLTMIGGYAEVMRDIPDERTPENMQIVIDETARLSTLVNELLDFSRMQTGSVAMTPVDFCLTDAVEGIINRIGKLTAKDGYTIHFAPSQRVMTHADETRISQVVYNLIGNALTYTGPDKDVTVTQEICGGLVRIAVRDRGKGIAPEELPLIWNRYYRTRETHRRAVVGSGLGLNIVRSILELHNAPYGVESTEGVGTTFWFELPEVRE